MSLEEEVVNLTGAIESLEVAEAVAEGLERLATAIDEMKDCFGEELARIARALEKPVLTVEAK
jgi:hypothetical protein